jgi:FixJ family two-component response regulator
MSDALRTVVVVDDDTEMGQAIKRLLSAAGHRVTTFESAEALLADEGAMRGDCFVFDVHLPGLSGFDLQQRIAMHGVVAPVIFITGYDDVAAREQARQSGAVALLIKPFQGQLLLSAIAGALPHPQPTAIETRPSTNRRK